MSSESTPALVNRLAAERAEAYRRYNDTLTALDRAIQAHGALGMTDDTPLAWWYRHERAARIYDGADEVHRTVIARRALKPYLPPRAPSE